MPTQNTKFMTFCTALIISGLLFLATLTPAHAVSLGQNGSWEGYSEIENGARICFMGSEPTKSRGKYKKRGQAFILLTHRPAEKSKNVVSVKAGYTYKAGSEVKIKIGKTTFQLMTTGEHAFAHDSKADDALSKAMIRGSTMVISGVSSRGTKTTDTYSLTGFNASYKAIGKACNL